MKKDRYDSWEGHILEEVHEDCLKTLEYIHDNLSRDTGKAYSSQQCDDVKDCLKILSIIDMMEEEAPAH